MSGRSLRLANCRVCWRNAIRLCECPCSVPRVSFDISSGHDTGNVTIPHTIFSIIPDECKQSALEFLWLVHGVENGCGRLFNFRMEWNLLRPPTLALALLKTLAAHCPFCLLLSLQAHAAIRCGTDRWSAVLRLHRRCHLV